MKSASRADGLHRANPIINGAGVLQDTLQGLPSVVSEVRFLDRILTLPVLVDEGVDERHELGLLGRDRQVCGLGSWINWPGDRFDRPGVRCPTAGPPQTARQQATGDE